jgi:hypothetical protein
LNDLKVVLAADREDLVVLEGSVAAKVDQVEVDPAAVVATSPSPNNLETPIYTGTERSPHFYR